MYIKKYHELPALIEKHGLKFCVCGYLKVEFASVVNRDRIKQYLSEPPEFYISYIDDVLKYFDIDKKYSGSPDINDDYLIDVVIQTDATALVTGDKSLLNWKNAPIQIVSWLNFQLSYPLE